MTKLSLKKTRILKFFIDATAALIQEEGIEGITIRKIAERSGYNSATIYNYFENLDHLIFLAALHFIKPYATNVSSYAQKGKNALEKNILIWEYFCIHSFSNPELYNAIFFAKLSNPLDDYIADYYALYPEELVRAELNVSKMLNKQNIYERAHIILEPCVEEGFLDEASLDPLNEMILFVYKGILLQVLNKELDEPLEATVARALNYIKICYNGFLKKGKLDVVE